MVRQSHEHRCNSPLVELQPHGPFHVTIQRAPVVEDEGDRKGSGFSMGEKDVDGDEVVLGVVAGDRAWKGDHEFVPVCPLSKRTHLLELDSGGRLRRLRGLGSGKAKEAADESDDGESFGWHS